MGSEAEMPTATEGLVVGVDPLDVEAVGLRIGGRIAVGGRQGDGQRFPLRDRVAVDLDVPMGDPPRVRDGAVVAQDLFDRVLHQLAPRAELCELVRVAQDRSEASDVPVSVVVRIGDPAATILEVVQEIEPEMLLVGVPREGGASVFHDTRFNHFVARVEELGVRIEIVSTKPGA